MRKEWFWSETRLSAALLALQPKLAASSDPQHKILGNLTLIPATERHRLANGRETRGGSLPICGPPRRSA
jgi:hypothetical protein